MADLNKRRCVYVILVVASLGYLTTSCATLQAPVSPPPLQPREFLRGSREGIDIAVKPIVEEDEYLQLFDDNLPSIGIVALWVQARNMRATAIELNLASWYIRIANRSFPALSVQKVLERYYKGRNVRMYAIGADRAARLSMERVAFHQGRIQPSAEQDGFVFFRIDPSISAGWTHGATLGMEDIRLDRHSKTNLEVALSHANP
ncbi:MAG: hypothetical protein ABSH28_03060 [Acidobacteriota bacterium]